MAFRVSMNYGDPSTAQRVVNALMDAYKDSDSSASNVQVIDAASLPLRPAYPNHWILGFASLLCGMATLGLLFLVRRWKLVPR